MVAGLLAIAASAADAPARPKGLKRPSERQRVWQAIHMVRAEAIQPNWLGLERIGASGRAGTKLLKDATAKDLPSSVDNSTLPWFPPIGDQGELASCAAFSATYYQMTHMVGLARGDWPAKTGGDEYWFSPKWTYNMVNEGMDLGAFFTDVYEVLLKHGCPSWSKWPYDGTDYLSWCLDKDVWREALAYRLTESGYVANVSTTGLAQLKGLLNNGYVLVFGTDFDSWHTGLVKDDPATAGVDPHTGKTVCLWVDDSEQGGHAMTVVGYDDTVWCDVNGNNIVDAGEKGALKIANSWGASWEDGGFVWFAYDALRRYSAVSGVSNIGRAQGFWYDEAYYITARPYPYVPKLLAEFELSHAWRSDMAVKLGRSDLTRQTPSSYWTPGALQNAGGPYALDGSEGPAVKGGFVFDFSELAVYGSARRYYLSVTDTLADDPATIFSFKLIDVYARKEIASTNTFPKTADASTVHVWVDYTFDSHSQRPYVSLTSPTNGQIFQALSQVELVASASDPDGTVVKVEFYSGSIKLGEDTVGSDGWSMLWQPPTGLHTLTARAVDNSGDATLSAAVKITVNPPPAVSITSPKPGAEFVEGTDVVISVEATDPDGVVLVEFFEGSNKLGEDNSSPWQFSWPKPSPGDYTLSAKATDTYGASGISEPVAIKVVADSDSDGMPDYWEDLHGFDKNDPSDAGADADSDDLVNVEEYRHRTDPYDPDSDDDDLTDGYEVTHPPLDPNNPDTDGDGLADGEEIALGTDPALSDTDSDGMPDGWEVRWGLNPLLADANIDSDGDGFSNYAEYLAGTDPLDPASHPRNSGSSGGLSCEASPQGTSVALLALAFLAGALRKAKRRAACL